MAAVEGLLEYPADIIGAERRGWIQVQMSNRARITGLSRPRQRQEVV
jgi:hypothetical protein